MDILTFDYVFTSEVTFTAFSYGVAYSIAFFAFVGLVFVISYFFYVLIRYYFRNKFKKEV